MKPLRAFLRKFLAFALIGVLLTMRLGSFSYESFVQPIEHFIAKTAFVADGNVKAPSFPFKNKRTLLDNCTLSCELLAAPAPVPERENLVWSRILPPPEVYFEPFVPPA
ncbi:hypothetical protein [Geoalkalibacter sp.]|uniref:hypothetical protein n=1 Tax=Geoalkalibacter sp. TaxID=3041440 RepID=UPI00272EAB83|nr:hypothetical protein [Geoalkalibacter sp.]